MGGTRHNVRCAGVLLYDKGPGVMLSAAGAERIRGGLRFRSCRKRTWKQGTQTSRRLKQGAGESFLPGAATEIFGNSRYAFAAQALRLEESLGAHEGAAKNDIPVSICLYY